MTFVPRANRTVVTEMYEDLKDLVVNTATQFAYKFNQDIEECVAQANLAFLEAYHGFKPEKGTTIQQRVVSIVWNRLYDQVRGAARKKLTTEDAPAGAGAGVDWEGSEGEQIHPAVIDLPRFDLEEFACDVSEDAEMVMRLLLESPEPLNSAIRADERPSPRSIKGHLRRYLVDNLGWAASRAAEAFREVWKAIQ